MVDAGHREAEAALRASHVECKATLSSDPMQTESQTPELPPVMIQGWNFAKAFAAHAADGFRRCTKKQIETRVKICQSCDKLIDDHCSLCGCACVEGNRLVSKLAWASSECPLEKWKKL